MGTCGGGVRHARACVDGFQIRKQLFGGKRHHYSSPSFNVIFYYVISYNVKIFCVSRRLLLLVLCLVDKISVICVTDPS